MTIYAIRTISTPSIIAKDAPPRPLPKPKLSMVDDAKLCNRRLLKISGQERPQYGGREAKQNRSAAALERDKAMAIEVLAMLRSKGPMNRTEIMRNASLSDDVSRRVVRYMRDQGMITVTGRGGLARWMVV
jgi:predicted transcriptional regulator